MTTVTNRITQSIATMGSNVMESLKEAHLQEKIESGVSSVREGVNAMAAKLTDPQLQKEVKEKAQAGWNWLSGAATSLWSAAVNTANSIAAEFTEGGKPKEGETGQYVQETKE